MKRANRAFMFTLVAALLIQACGDEKKARNYNQKTLVDQQGLMFINKAAESGATEVKASMVAQEISKNSRIVEFAGMMVADHTQAGNELGQLAKNKLVSKMDTISKAHQKTIDSISKLTGAAFDKAYISMMVKDHAAAVQLFSDASSNRDKQLQEFAHKTLPALKMHQDTANAIQASLK